MNNSLKGALGLAAILFVGIFAVWFTRPYFQKREEAKKSQAAEVQRDREERQADVSKAFEVKTGGDSYRGYEILRSRTMSRQAVKDGVKNAFLEDEGDIDARFKRLKDGSLNMAVMPVDRVIYYSLKYDFPAVIVAALSESVDADVILGKKSRFPSGDVMLLNDSSISLSYVEGTPMEFLTNLTVNKLDLFNLSSTDRWRDKCATPSEVFEKAIKGQGDAFALWEPEASMALAKNPELVKLWGSSELRGYIIDVLVVSKKFLADHPSETQKYLSAYFLALDEYSGDRTKLVQEMTERNNQETATQIDESLKKVYWFDLTDNCAEFYNIQPGPGLPAREGLVDTIQRCADVLLASKSISAEEHGRLANPYKLIGSEQIRNLKDAMPGIVQARGQKKRVFTKLSDQEWAAVAKSKGVPLRVDPVSFLPNSSELTEDAKASLQSVAGMLRDSFGAYRVIIRGHTGNDDQVLSLERAKTARQYLIVLGIDQNRLYAEGLGSKEPPVKHPDETNRDWRYRHSRVEFNLIKETALGW